MFSWKTALITLAIFGLGGLAGSLITAQVIKSKIEQVQTTTVPPGWQEGDYPSRMLRVMETELKLTPEQVHATRGILRRAQAELLKLNAEWQQKAAELKDDSADLLAARNEWRIKSRRLLMKADESVRELLTEQQRPLWPDFLHKRRMPGLQSRPPGLPLQRPGDRGPDRPPPAPAKTEPK